MLFVSNLYSLRADGSKINGALLKEPQQEVLRLEIVFFAKADGRNAIRLFAFPELIKREQRSVPYDLCLALI